MTDPDGFPAEFPTKGTWSVNQMLSTGHYFIIEAQGDGMGSTLPSAQYWRGVSDSIEYRTLLEQICARHNEGIREEAETYAEIRKAMHRDDAAEEKANMKSEEGG